MECVSEGDFPAISLNAFKSRGFRLGKDYDGNHCLFFGG